MEVKEAISAAGVDSSPYSEHSFRSGAATTAARQGIAEGDDPKVRPMEEQRLPAIHKDAKTRAGGSVTVPGRQPMRLRRTKYGMGYRPIRDHKVWGKFGRFGPRIYPQKRGKQLGGSRDWSARRAVNHSHPCIVPRPSSRAVDPLPEKVKREEGLVKLITRLTSRVERR